MTRHARCFKAATDLAQQFGFKWTGLNTVQQQAFMEVGIIAVRASEVFATETPLPTTIQTMHVAPPNPNGWLTLNEMGKNGLRHACPDKGLIWVNWSCFASDPEHEIVESDLYGWIDAEDLAARGRRHERFPHRWQPVVPLPLTVTVSLDHENQTTCVIRTPPGMLPIEPAKALKQPEVTIVLSDD